MTTDPGPDDTEFDDADPFEIDPADLDHPDQSPVAGPTDPLFSPGDTTALAAQLLEPAIREAVNKQVSAVAAQAVEAAFTTEVLEHLRAEAVEATQVAVEAATSPDTAEQTLEEPPQLYYGSTNEFVRDYLRHVYQRKINGQHTYWSAQWWRSAEAISRLEALWRAWEYLRLDPSTGMSVWWRDHADPHMAVLMSSTGPFSKDYDTQATVADPLPHEEPPAGLFPDARLD